MIPHFKNPPGFDHRYSIGLANGREPMGDDQTGPTLKEMLESQLNLLLGGGIHAGRGFVEDQNRGDP